MRSEFSIRKATKQDYQVLSLFIGGSEYVHRHLDWRASLDWLGCDPYLILKKNEGIQAVLACPPDPPGIAWIRLFAVSLSSIKPSLAWDILFTGGKQILEPDFPITFAALGFQDWLIDLLIENNFSHHQDIVVLEWAGNLPGKLSLPKGMVLRPMVQADLAAVQILDELAFDQLWQNSMDDLTLALSQAAYATVLEVESRIIAYQISTPTSFGAHLARLAVLPDFQRQHIGSMMVRNLQEYFRDKGFATVSVNTQDDNQASLALYQRMGFHLIGESFPVYTCSMIPTSPRPTNNF
jgi:ribosomal protein S18 acetylase RimI-like enzyme